MNFRNRHKKSITEPLLKELDDRENANSKLIKNDPSVESTPREIPDLYQDSGGGYNSDLTFPQE